MVGNSIERVFYIRVKRLSILVKRDLLTIAYQGKPLDREGVLVSVSLV